MSGTNGHGRGTNGVPGGRSGVPEGRERVAGGKREARRHRTAYEGRTPNPLRWRRDAYKFTQTLLVCVYFSSASRP